MTSTSVLSRLVEARAGTARPTPLRPAQTATVVADPRVLRAFAADRDTVVDLALLERVLAGLHRH